MVTVDAGFSSAAVAQSPRTRIRIYLINEDVDYTDDADVIDNGTLITYSAGEQNSNSAIANTGVRFSEYYTKDTDWTIGNAVSNSVSFALLNDTGRFSSTEFWRCKIYIDLYYASSWHTCPMGVYMLEQPTKRKTSIISMVGHDLISTLDTYADDWWESIDFSMGYTIADIIDEFADHTGLILKPWQTFLNGGFSFENAPFHADKTTYRSILSRLAEITASNARIDRNGYLEFKWFTATSETIGYHFSADVAEYEVEKINSMLVRSSESDIGFEYGQDGNNQYTITNNPFIDETNGTNVFTRLSSFAKFTPMSVSTNVNWAVEVGDIVSVTVDGSTVSLPIFQQELVWNGGSVSGSLVSSGNALRDENIIPQTLTESEFRSQKALHELRNTVDELTSRIADMGTSTEISQTAEQIMAIVQSLESSVTALMNDHEVLYEFSHNGIDEVNNLINANDTELKTYIRFSATGIVLGRTDDELKLKIMQNGIMFYAGDDDETDMDNAVAYFTFKEFYDAIAKTSRYVQIGNAGDGTDWQWVKRANGHISLWRI